MKARALQTRLAHRDSTFPDEFRDLSPAVEEIWLRGDESLLGAGPRVALVGTRSPTPYGLDQARCLAWGLARAGVVVVSGLARGIDEASHLAALDAGGATIGVLGSGLDRIWPAGPAAERMLKEGLLLSEYAPETPPRRHHFPLRNRLIAALSSAVVVVEAARRSGSLITARWALDLGREVLAVPGRVDHPLARGTHQLLREGAGLVESTNDILECLGHALACPPGTNEAIGKGQYMGLHTGLHTGPQSGAPMPENPLLAALVGETLAPAELAQRTDQPLSRVLADLSLLELDGRVARVPGGLYRLVRVTK